MAYPVEISYEAESGATMYIGCEAPIVYPAWATKDANEWIEISGTSGTDGQPMNAWGDFSINQDTGEILFGLLGGHNDGYQTRMSSLPLLSDAPAYVRLKESIPIELALYSNGVNIYPYCLDGTTPSSRHPRYSTHYCPQNNRLMYIGSPSLYGSGGESSPVSNGFNLATNEWDPPGTYASTPFDYVYGTAIDDLGNIWCRYYKYNRAANTYTALPSSYANTSAFDTSRRKLFALVKGNGQGYDTHLGLIAKTFNEDCSAYQTITFNASAALTEFSSFDLDYSGMTYDPVRDRFLYYWGKAGAQGVIYIITPNGTNVWDVSKLVQGPNSVLPSLPPTSGAGINNRFKYLAALDGVVLITRESANVYFMKLG